MYSEIPSGSVQKYFHIICFAVLLVICGHATPGKAQLYESDSYEIRVAPHLWFNSVDGVTVGVRFRGEDPRTFLDGPHRINAGVSLGTRLPDTPVAYSLSYAHPVSVLSGADAAGELRALTSVRTGFHRHEAGIQKRWQPGFDEYVTTGLHVFAGVYQHFDDDYLLYDALWQDDPVFYLRSSIRKRDRNTLGRRTMKVTAISGQPVTTDSPFVDFSGKPAPRPDMLGVESLFGKIQLEVMQLADLFHGFYTRARLFGGISSASLPREHRFLTSDAAAFEWMESPLTRARGTIPPDWMTSGWVHVTGGPSLRGYTFRTTDQHEAGSTVWAQHAISANLDLYYPNPVNTWFSKIPYLGDVLRLESYLFTDAGLFYEENDWQDVRMNAGAGFMLSLNVPDYMGEERGFFIRYELPVWLSEVTDGENHFEIRHILGIGTQFRM